MSSSTPNHYPLNGTLQSPTTGNPAFLALPYSDPISDLQLADDSISEFLRGCLAAQVTGDVLALGDRAQDSLFDLFGLVEQVHVPVVGGKESTIGLPERLR